MKSSDISEKYVSEFFITPDKSIGNQSSIQSDGEDTSMGLPSTIPSDEDDASIELPGTISSDGENTPVSREISPAISPDDFTQDFIDQYSSVPDALPEIPCSLELKLAQMKKEMSKLEKTLIESKRTKIEKISKQNKLNTVQEKRRENVTSETEENLLVVKIDEFKERSLATINDVERNESWKEQMQEWTYALLEDGVCAGSGRNFRIKKCVVIQSMYDWKVIK